MRILRDANAIEDEGEWKSCGFEASIKYADVPRQVDFRQSSTTTSSTARMDDATVYREQKLIGWIKAGNTGVRRAAGKSR